MEIPRLREWRYRRGLSQQQLADRVGKARDTMSKIETGAQGVRPSTARLLATALDIDVQDLMELPLDPKVEPIPLDLPLVLEASNEDFEHALTTAPWQRISELQADLHKEMVRMDRRYRAEPEGEPRQFLRKQLEQMQRRWGQMLFTSLSDPGRKDAHGQTLTDFLEDVNKRHHERQARLFERQKAG